VLVHHRGGLCFSSFLDYTVQLRHSQPTHTHP
jgi:hypothetical protein